MSDSSTDPRPAIGRMVARDFCGDQMPERLMMYERRIENSLYRAINELRQLRREQKAGTEHSRVRGPTLSVAGECTKQDQSGKAAVKIVLRLGRGSDTVAIVRAARVDRGHGRQGASEPPAMAACTLRRRYEN
jgi:hypothetical protein